MALPAREGWPGEETLRKAERARQAKRTGALVWEVLILAGLAAAYLWALECRSRALMRAERASKEVARLEALCRQLRAEIAVLSSQASLERTAKEAGLSPPEDGRVDFLVVPPLRGEGAAPLREAGPGREGGERGAKGWTEGRRTSNWWR